MTALERLRLLAGPGGTTGDALKRLAGTAGVAGVLLVAYSGLDTGTAAQHLLYDRAVLINTLSGPDFEPSFRKTKIANQNKAVIAMLVSMIASGAI